jgi:hypothetical protein
MVMVVLVLVAYLRRMSPPPSTATRLRTWRATLLRQRAQPLGTVEAPDERAAEAAAAGQFGLTAEQRRRLVVQDDAD